LKTLVNQQHRSASVMMTQQKTYRRTQVVALLADMILWNWG